MAESVVPALTSIAEEEEVVFDDTITDPARLKRFRTTAKMIHTNAGKKLIQSVKVGEDRDTVRALRALYVRDFDSLEKHHDRYVQCNAPNCSQDDYDGERDWIQAVIYDHQEILAKCDDYLVQTNPKPASTVSRASSRHSSVSSRQARIHEAERKEREAQLMLRQVEDETRRREEEDAKIREAEDYKRKVESERKQREIRDEIDLQRLSGAIMRQQLNDVTVNDQAAPTRASSVVSGLSRNANTNETLQPTGSDGAVNTKGDPFRQITSSYHARHTYTFHIRATYTLECRRVKYHRYNRYNESDVFHTVVYSSTAGNDESAHVNGFKRRYSANVVLPGSYTDRSADYDIDIRSNSYVGSSSGPYIDCTIVRPTNFRISRRSGLYISGSSVHTGDYSYHPRPDDQ
ncbi:hypothetical protein DAPPUDRAFT_334155 [Daphnia pulex]|uniref:Uncharacterized protein n=1 Tax=Daphnia pulex TaxID=6669 RepID=E9HUW1_DAPPU|nr:hypothetical protein DAPPUDRAFT_334155 [Daphnia pulex]|eukprot:EFX64473.1 hypothetical protein DAPPUDRAFT_334155 [Daphnia pulex]